MPLILLTGYPSSGLTHRATQIATHFTTHPPPSSSPTNFQTIHLSDITLAIPRSAYNTSSHEKSARATLSSAIKRHLSRDTLLIVDGMNYIKGFRYQMWCEAKAAGTTCCVLHVAVSPGRAAALHAQRPESERYAAETFENLIARYEEPSAAARWDSPLFTVVFEDEGPPVQKIEEALWPVVSGGKGKLKKGFVVARKGAAAAAAAATDDGNAAALEGDGEGKVMVVQHLATVAPKAMASDALYVLEGATGKVVQSVMAYLAMAGSAECCGEMIRVFPVGGGAIEASNNDDDDDNDNESSGSNDEIMLHLPLTGTLSVGQLQRLKRQFVSLYRSRGVGMGAATSAGIGGLGGVGGELSERRVVAGFVAFLESSFHAGDG